MKFRRRASEEHAQRWVSLQASAGQFVDDVQRYRPIHQYSEKLIRNHAQVSDDTAEGNMYGEENGGKEIVGDHPRLEQS